MTIEIHTPELEDLILERMHAGAFESIEATLMQALESSPLPSKAVREPAHDISTGADLVAVMQMSPYREIVLEPARSQMPVRDFVF